MRNNFAKNLIKLRAEKQMSQEQLAAKIGVSRQTVTSWENGKIQPNASNLAEIANLFGITIDRLVNSDYKREIITDFAEKGLKTAMKKTKKAKKVAGILVLGWPIIAIIYTILGLTFNNFGEPYMWGIFPLYALIGLVINVIFDENEEEK